jgi:hypothetical protein
MPVSPAAGQFIYTLISSLDLHWTHSEDIPWFRGHDLADVANCKLAYAWNEAGRSTRYIEILNLFIKLQRIIHSALEPSVGCHRFARRKATLLIPNARSNCPI